MTATLAVFDFDGTLFTGNSPTDFARFVHGRPAFWPRMLAFLPVYCLYRAGIISGDACKERFLALFFRGQGMGRLRDHAERYAARITGHLDPFHRERLAHHRAAGHRLVVVSATFAFIVAPWCEAMGLELLATAVEVAGGQITGKLRGENCHGEAKVRALAAAYPLDRCRLFAYGDSPSDLPLLRRADRAYYRGRPLGVGALPAMEGAAS